MMASVLAGTIGAALAVPAVSQFSAAPSQVLILGMHHSGTSVLANLTMMMGLYGGAQEEMLLHADNPLKFWERRDVVTLDERRIRSGVGSAGSRYNIPNWIGYGFDPGKAAERVDESREARLIVAELNRHRPWVTKDPRLCLVAHEWMQLLDSPLCLIIHRDPLAIANSMMIYSHNVSFAEWGSVFEAYYLSAKRACRGVPTLTVEHDTLMSSPHATLSTLYAQLVRLGVRGLTLPSAAAVQRLLGAPRTHAPDTYLAAERKMLGGANAVSASLKNDAALSQPQSEASTAAAPATAAALPPSSPSPLWHVSPRVASEAFATLLTTANGDYLRGALVLGTSIRTFDSARDLVCLVTTAVPREWRSALQVVGWNVVQVEELEEPWWAKSAECSRFDGDQGERWGHMATKLRLWQLEQYARVLYLDADAALTGSASDVFASVSGFGAERPRFHSHFNAGVLLLSPSAATFAELLALGAQPPKRIFNNVVDCTEQGLLNAYFNGSALDGASEAGGRGVTKLAVGRADVPSNWSDASASPFAVHWITHACPKPWVVADDAAVPAHCDAVAYAYWRRLWERLTSSATDSSSAHKVGSREAARRRLRRLAGVAAGPSMVAQGHSPTKRQRRPAEYDAPVSEWRQLAEYDSGRRRLAAEYDAAPRRLAEYDRPQLGSWW